MPAFVYTEVYISILTYNNITGDDTLSVSNIQDNVDTSSTFYSVIISNGGINVYSINLIKKEVESVYNINNDFGNIPVNGWLNVKITNDDSYIGISNTNNYTYLFFSETRTWNTNSTNYINQIIYKIIQKEFLLPLQVEEFSPF